ncbi:hypothetical protein [Geothrix sp. PMB-07]|uniref:hypothetical protein n=1 Tax=Geothrix sp. PMB-07 TaxID=3068640 RepID=UPI002741C6B3|nr:hypothetical protein [Geothrix sp. PMB-07]WLT30649.1 hypothetical protein Q9293_13085 [Geothrix sp. PMB-07]
MGLIHEIAYLVVSAVFPCLTAETFASWRLGRRLTSGALAGLLIMGAMPAKAQTTDVPAFWQRAAEYMKTAYREVKSDLQWVESKATTDYWAVRQAMATYEDYQNGVRLYQRVTNPNTSINLIQGMPMLEAFASQTDGAEDHWVLRPVLRPQQRLNSPHLPGMNFGGFEDIYSGLKTGNLNFDLDHFTIVRRADDANLSPAELQKRATEDAWGNWRSAQKINEVEEAYYDVPFDASTYIGLKQETQAYFRKRRETLQRSAEFLSARGQDDPTYQAALKLLSDLNDALAKGEDTQAAENTANRLLKIDGQAAEVVAIVARLRVAVGEVAKRQSTKHDNIQELKSQYKPPAEGVLSFTSWFNKLGDNNGKTANKEQLSAAMLANAHAEASGTNVEEQLKHNLLTQIQDQNDKLRDFASQKARAFQDMRGIMGDQWYAEQMGLLNLQIQQDTTMARLRLILAKLPSPTMIPVRVPDQLATLPGTIPASSAQQVKNPAEAIAADLPAKLASRLSDVTGYVKSSKTMSLGALQPVLEGLDAGARAVFGKSFNLSSWGS